MPPAVPVPAGGGLSEGGLGESGTDGEGGSPRVVYAAASSASAISPADPVRGRPTTYVMHREGTQVIDEDGGVSVKSIKSSLLSYAFLLGYGKQ